MKKIALITGVNSGIGFETAKALAMADYNLILTVRSTAKAQETQAKLLKINPNIAVDAFIADLNDINAIKKVAKSISEKYAAIDRIICNAGYSPDALEFKLETLDYQRIIKRF